MEAAWSLVPTLMWILAAASLLVTAILGIVLTYHWFRYAMNPGVTIIACVVYAAVSGVLLSGMAAALTAFPPAL